jgi:hypothetical protein
MTPNDSFNIAFWHYGKGKKSGVAGKVTRQYLPPFLRAKHDEHQKISLRPTKTRKSYVSQNTTSIYHLISNYKRAKLGGLQTPFLTAILSIIFIQARTSWNLLSIFVKMANLFW